MPFFSCLGPQGHPHPERIGPRFLAPDAAWSARAGLHVERTRGDTVRGMVSFFSAERREVQQA